MIDRTSAGAPEVALWAVLEETEAGLVRLGERLTREEAYLLGGPLWRAGRRIRYQLQADLDGSPRSPESLRRSCGPWEGTPTAFGVRTGD